jgi:hypothetical protein
MRYVLAIVVIGVLVAAGAAFVSQTERSVDRLIRQGLREAKAAGQLPEGVDPDQPELPAFGVQLPDSMMWRIKLSHFLLAWRFVLVGLLILASLATAHAFRRQGT